MTWTIEMNSKELARKREIERALDKRITQKEAALRLEISERQVRRWIQSYRREGVSGIVSKRRGRPSNRKTDQVQKEEVLRFINDEQMKGFGPTFMAEKLEQLKGIRLSKETMRRFMLEAGVWKAKTRKNAEPHYSRERRYHRGELVQIDGSYHAWLEERGPKGCLLVFVDDATSGILAAEFAGQESYFAYGDICKRYFRDTGLPMSFYSDRFSVFRTNRREGYVDEPVTQFQRALKELGVDLICANSPQAKGRVERANQTLQDRLVKEMRLLGISSYDEANRYLPTFIQDYNARFAVRPADNLDYHRKLDLNLDLDFLFSVHDFRKVSKTLTFQFAKVTYQIETSRPAYVYAEQEVLVTCDYDQSVTAWFHGTKLDLKIITKAAKSGRVVSSKSPEAQPIPPNYNHPWRTYGKKLNGKPVLNTLSTE